MRALIIILLLLQSISASGGYDNATATGKGQFQLDLTWNPFGVFNFGQDYAVLSYGITNQLDIHGYISNHQENYQTFYTGIFYQFLNNKSLELATAIGFRKRLGEKWTHIFFPQLLYTANLTKRISFSGSFVNVRNEKLNSSYGISSDLGMFYKLNYETKYIENISIGISGFHPTTWEPNAYFLPTYSVDIKFKRF